MNVYRPSCLALALAVSLATSGCKLPGSTATAEGVIGGSVNAGAMRVLHLRGDNGAPLDGVQVIVDGQTFTVSGGTLSIPESLFQEAVRAGNMILVAPGHVPVRVDPQAALNGVILPGVSALGSPVAFSAASANQLSSPNSAITLAVPGTVFTSSGQLALALYVPSGQLDAQDAEYAQDMSRLATSRGVAAPAAGSCISPLACLPLKQSLGLSLTADGTLTGSGKNGTLTASYDLAKMLNGWDGTGTPPWETGATGWTDEMKSEALAAAQILATYKAIDASPDAASLRAGMTNAFGLTLTGTVLTFPVTPDPAALASGYTRVRIPGSELLGTSLEVTLSTSNVNDSFTLAQDASGIDLNKIVLADGKTAAQILAQPAPTEDKTGKTASENRGTTPLPGVTRPGSSLDAGIALVTDAPVGSGGSVTGSSLGSQGTYTDGSIPGLTSAQLNASSVVTLLSNASANLISDNSGGLISNNSGGLISNNSGGLVSNNSGGLVSGNGAGVVVPGNQLISNNAGSLVSNNGGQMSGFPYMPIAPELAKYQLLDVGVPTPPYQRTTPTGLTEYLWEGLGVRAIDVEGTPLTDWVVTGSDGSFHLTFDAAKTPRVFFLECAGGGNKIHAYSLVFSPGANNVVAPVDSATTQLAVSTMELFNFCPPESGRMGGLNAAFTGAATDAYAAADKAHGKTADQLNDYGDEMTEDAEIAAARQAEINAAFAAFDPAKFEDDHTADMRVLTAATAIANAKSTDSVAIYNTLYGSSLAARSLRPITLISPF